jgi:hypothetical protein
LKNKNVMEPQNTVSGKASFSSGNETLVTTFFYIFYLLVLILEDVKRFRKGETVKILTKGPYEDLVGIVDDVDCPHPGRYMILLKEIGLRQFRAENLESPSQRKVKSTTYILFYIVLLGIRILNLENWSRQDMFSLDWNFFFVKTSESCCFFCYFVFLI